MEVVLRCAPLIALIALIVSLGAFVGCAGEPVSLEVSWLLGDGRTCDEAGVVEVEVDIQSSATATATFTCEEGFAPNTVGLGEYESGIVELDVRARDADGTVRYSASGRLDLRDEGAVLAPMQLRGVEDE